jgi:hypothetical protein
MLVGRLSWGKRRITIRDNTEPADGNRERVLFGATPDLTSPVPNFHSSSSHLSLLALCQFFISILQSIPVIFTFFRRVFLYRPISFPRTMVGVSFVDRYFISPGRIHRQYGFIESSIYAIMLTRPL